MIFRRYYSIPSNQNADNLRKKFLGQHLKIHELDFEIFEKEGNIKVIPHAENDEHMHTLPITRLKFLESGNGTVIKMVSKPRRIDIGGPYLLMVFILFAILAGLMLIKFSKGEYDLTAYILIVSALVVFAVLWIKMERGYFDYIRKVKKWVKAHA
jgi:hypothetical protein